MDATALVVDVLEGALGVPVSTEIPTDRPGRLVSVALEADRSTPFLLMPTYRLMCWGDSDVDAKSIAMAAVEALWDAALDHPYLSAADLETLSRTSWSKTGQARYEAVVSLVINTDE